MSSLICPNCNDECLEHYVTPPLAPGVGGVRHCGCFYDDCGEYHIGNTDIPSIEELEKMKPQPRKRRPSTPGDILRQEFLGPYEMTQGELANKIGVARRRIDEIVVGKRAITADTAIRFALFFGTTPEFWMSLQAAVDLWDCLHDRSKAKVYKQINAHLVAHGIVLPSVEDMIDGSK